MSDPQTGQKACSGPFEGRGLDALVIGAYRLKCDNVAASGYRGFAMRQPLGPGSAARPSTTREDYRRTN